MRCHSTPSADEDRAFPRQGEASREPARFFVIQATQLPLQGRPWMR